LFVAQSVLHEVRQHLITASTDEPFGFLLGQVVYCPWTETPYVLIDAVRRETQNLPPSDEVDRFRHAWIGATRDARHRREQLIGWYHRHGVLGMRMSEWDLKLQDEFFPEPWQVALIVAASSQGPIGGFIQRSHRARLFRKGLAPFHELIDLDAKRVDDMKASVVDWTNYQAGYPVHIIAAKWPSPRRNAERWSEASHSTDGVVPMKEPEDTAEVLEFPTRKPIEEPAPSARAPFDPELAESLPPPTSSDGRAPSREESEVDQSSSEEWMAVLASEALASRQTARVAAREAAAEKEAADKAQEDSAKKAADEAAAKAADKATAEAAARAAEEASTKAEHEAAIRAVEAAGIRAAEEAATRAVAEVTERMARESAAREAEESTAEEEAQRAAEEEAAREAEEIAAKEEAAQKAAIETEQAAEAARAERTARSAEKKAKRVATKKAARAAKRNAAAARAQKEAAARTEREAAEDAAAAKAAEDAATAKAAEDAAAAKAAEEAAVAKAAEEATVAKAAEEAAVAKAAEEATVAKAAEEAAVAKAKEEATAAKAAEEATKPTIEPIPFGMAGAPAREGYEDGIPVVLVKGERWRPTKNVMRTAAGIVLLLGVGVGVRALTGGTSSVDDPLPPTARPPTVFQQPPAEFTRLEGEFRSAVRDYRARYVAFQQNRASCEALATDFDAVNNRFDRLAEYSAARPSTRAPFSPLDASHRGAVARFASTNCPAFVPPAEVPLGGEGGGLAPLEDNIAPPDARPAETSPAVPPQ